MVKKDQVLQRFKDLYLKGRRLGTLNLNVSLFSKCLSSHLFRGTILDHESILDSAKISRTRTQRKGSTTGTTRVNATRPWSDTSKSTSTVFHDLSPWVRRRRTDPRIYWFGTLISLSERKDGYSVGDVKSSSI